MTYRLLTYQHGDVTRAGLSTGANVLDIAGKLDKPAYADMLAILEDWTAAEPLLDELAARPDQNGLPLKDVRLLSPVRRPGTIYCAGANYRDHVDNMARRLNIATEPDPHELGLNPWHFIKSSACVVGQDAKVELDSEFLDWEAELAVVIGRTARRISMGEVFEHVAGYTIGNDLSARDRTQREAVNIASPFRYDWIGQKNFNGACPLGPWIVPAKFIKNPGALAIRTYVNDTIKQNSDTSKMLFNIAEQVSYLSSRLTLHPGDIVLTGTPAGVGAETGEKLSRGDRVRVQIEGVGELTTDIV